MAPKKRYIIMETPCYPHSWKVVSVRGRHDNATYLFHPTVEAARDQVENHFNGEVVKVVPLKEQSYGI